MKNIIKKIFGTDWYCEMFHTMYGTKDNKWHCTKCNRTREKRLSDNYYIFKNEA